jgi:hypothetical protein
MLTGCGAQEKGPREAALWDALSDHFHGVVVHAGFDGEAPGLAQGSTPCSVTFTVGEPVAVVKVQLPEPGAFAMFRLALMFAVV